MPKDIMKYSKILKFYILNPNYKLKSSNWQRFATKGSPKSPRNRDDVFFLIIIIITKIIINYSQLLTYIIPKRLKTKTSSFEERKGQSYSCFFFKENICGCKSLEITRRFVEAMKK